MYDNSMRITVELPQDQAEAIERLSENERRACEVLIQAAVADYLEEDRKRRWALLQAGFGIWKNREIDGLEYERAIRAEWDRDPSE